MAREREPLVGNGSHQTYSFTAPCGDTIGGAVLQIATVRRRVLIEASFDGAVVQKKRGYACHAETRELFL